MKIAIVIFVFCLVRQVVSYSLCSGKIYYRPNCIKNDIEYISEDIEKCGSIRTGLESVGITTDSTKYIDICGSSAIKYCVYVDKESHVFLTTANGLRPNATCSLTNKKFITNLCECSKELNTRCVNTQKFKVADCISNGIRQSKKTLLVVMLIILFILY
ncbi:hypothetical protein ENUP19_0163G0028 [Entamoeba nuttalli]|uniref:Uncharacterized protein n=2 Tax=Entamoeba nuttalli TaxID=412467 RepID=K2H8H8_ENTNP|nr:hypothetical protein ENU1_151770 [Entamoeba nuttalli P19]EKE38829.1 hypothetical protein ENU1_151770 [Entamoeba nuttalli P19]|eukprot:XP_008858840.1 hypothetical protein ENU1_151770 [Entamoeba nuttalli P19]